jgi:hypothetical protein
MPSEGGRLCRVRFGGYAVRQGSSQITRHNPERGIILVMPISALQVHPIDTFEFEDHMFADDRRDAWS